MRKFDIGDFVTSSLKSTPSVDQKRKHLLHVCIIIIITSHSRIHVLALNYSECKKAKLIINQTDAIALN